jgi:hypothetical protein
MQTQMLLPLESNGREQRRRLWSQIPERDRAEFITQCARLIALAARSVTAPQQKEERHEADAR